MGQNRAFVYGDLLFETVRTIDGVPQLAKFHAERVAKSAALLEMELPTHWGESFFKDLIYAHAPVGNKRVRIVISRFATGFYMPSANEVAFSTEAWEYESKSRTIEKLGIYTASYKPCTFISNLKCGNALVPVMASKFAKAKGFDDVLLLNEHGRIAEATSSNIFVVKNKTLLTPALSEAPVEGVMRRWIIENAPKLGYVVNETELTIEQLKQADECFLTNAINGIISVNNLVDKKFKNKVSINFQRLFENEG